MTAKPADGEAFVLLSQRCRALQPAVPGIRLYTLWHDRRGHRVSLLRLPAYRGARAAASALLPSCAARDVRVLQVARCRARDVWPPPPPPQAGGAPADAGHRITLVHLDVDAGVDLVAALPAGPGAAPVQLLWRELTDPHFRDHGDHGVPPRLSSGWFGSPCTPETGFLCQALAHHARGDDDAYSVAYHGTGVLPAACIMREGFRTSSGGMFGPAVYAGSFLKAARFAMFTQFDVDEMGDGSCRRADGGAVLRCLLVHAEGAAAWRVTGHRDRPCACEACRRSSDTALVHLVDHEGLWRRAAPFLFIPQSRIDARRALVHRPEVACADGARVVPLACAAMDCHTRGTRHDRAVTIHDIQHDSAQCMSMHTCFIPM